MLFVVNYKIISGICGILAVAVSAIGMGIAVAIYPSFDWSTDFVSHLGSEGAVSAPFFNNGVIASGVLLFVFSIGLLKSLNNKISKFGCIAMAGAAIGLAGLGIYNLPHVFLHRVFTIPFFLLIPVSILLIGSGLLLNNKKGLGRKTIFAGAVISAFALGTLITRMMELPAFAVFETLASASGNIWVIAISIMLIRKKI